MTAMKRPNLNLYAVLLVLVALSSGCSGADENSATSNTNAPHQANSNSAAQSESAPSKAPEASRGTAPAVQPVPPPTLGSDVSRNTSASADANARAPKLVVSGKKIDFGKQPQNKTLVRAIVVKNGGRADLKIDSVVPS
jgi:hypothetical protein